MHKTVGQNHFFQRTASAERSAADCVDGTRKGDFCQIPAVSQAIFSKSGDTFGDGQFPDAGVAERIVAHCGHIRRELDALQTVAAAERAFRNFLHLFWKRKLNQFLAILKGVVAHRFY